MPLSEREFCSKRREFVHFQSRCFLGREQSRSFFSIPLFRRVLVTKKAKRKLQKLSPFNKLGEILLSVSSPLNPFKSRDPRKGNLQTVQTQIRCHRMWHLIRASTVCKTFRHFSHGISESHSLTYLKLKLSLPIFSVGESVQSKMG